MTHALLSLMEGEDTSEEFAASSRFHRTIGFQLLDRAFKARYLRVADEQDEHFASTSVHRQNVRLLADVALAQAHDIGFCRTLKIKAGVIRLLPDSLAQLDEWAMALRERREEALESIRREGVFAESWFCFELSGDTYLLAVMLLDPEKVPAEQQQDLEIDKIHKNFKKRWDRSMLIKCMVT